MQLAKAVLNLLPQIITVALLVNIKFRDRAVIRCREEWKSVLSDQSSVSGRKSRK